MVDIVNQGGEQNGKQGDGIRVDAVSVLVQIQFTFLGILDLGQFVVTQVGCYNAFEKFGRTQRYMTCMLKVVKGVLEVGSRNLSK